MKYDIYVSDAAKKKVLKLPVIPAEMPTLSRSSKNEEFETFNNGVYNIIGDAGPMEFTLESFLPGKDKKYPFSKVKNVNPDAYINLINAAAKNKKPIRVVIVRGNGTFVVNGTFSVESFEYHEDKTGDYQYSLSLKQWRTY